MAQEAIKPSAPGAAALVIIDMISDLRFEDASAIRAPACTIARTIRRLRDDADHADLPTIYVNDHFGHWHSERTELVAAASAGSADAQEIVRLLAPRACDYFVIKPQFSGFYATNLPVLLPKLGVRRMILTGIAADICVLFTAADAHMRDYGLWVPEDAIASFTPRRTRWAVEILQQSMGAETRSTEDCSVREWLGIAEP